MKNQTSKPAFQTGRYFKYAIGEIVLVVIGILIALQINNWNQNRMSKLEEGKLLRKIQVDLKLADSMNQRFLSSFTNYQNLNIQVFSEIRGKAYYNPNMMYHDLWWYSTYNAVISENYSDNLTDITNDNVRDALRDYLKHEEILLKAFKNWDLLKIETVRPFVNKYGIKNVDTIFSKLDFNFKNAFNLEFDIFNYSKLRAQYGTEELEQILGSLYTMTGYIILKLEEQKTYLDHLDKALKLRLQDKNN
ncbi:hypothetical protein CA834_10410 [Winogradskyella aurantia]|uniref:Uncharacterized protein n=2 Tax=Winogradskyella aurantia TaxID=1915063 RepID=A0A265URX8_9FLAO|nr:DUF6090 family protein [Winogradskyella aurantia]OZV68050.1 hypothetical protein CA834_10410 [Winogradskyella aurantia]